MGAGILAGNITGFFRVVLTAYLLGTHARADALAVAIGPVDFFNSAIMNTMLVAFVPMLMLRQGRDRAALFARAGRVFAWILALASAAIALLAPQIISVLGPGLAAEQHREAVILLRVMAPASFFAGTSALFSALLYTERRFIAPSLYQASLNGATIIAALSLWRAFGVNAFAIGYTSGAAVQLVVTWVVSRDLRSEHFTATRVHDPAQRYSAAAGDVSPLCDSDLRKHSGDARLCHTRRPRDGRRLRLLYALRERDGCLSGLSGCEFTAARDRAFTRIEQYPAGVPADRPQRGADGRGGSGNSRGRNSAAHACNRASFRAGQLYCRIDTAGVGSVLGIAPGILGWALLDLMSRCFFALDRPRLPLAAASIPVTINLAVMSMLGWRGLLGYAEILGLGASAGLMAGFAALYAAAHLRRQKTRLVPETAEV